MAAVPNSIKEALFQVGLDHAALVLELISFLGFAPGDRFTFTTLCDAVQIEYIDTNPNLIRRGLAQLVKHKILTWRPIVSEGRGRPTMQFSMGSWYAIAWTLGIELKVNENCDSPGETGFSSLKNYRKGLHYEYIRKRPGKYSRRFLGARLGVGRRTTWNYEEDTDIKVTPNWDAEELSLASIKFAPKTRQNGKFFIKSYDPTFKDEKVLPYTEFILRRELSLGRRVYKTWQSTNNYALAS